MKRKKHLIFMLLVLFVCNSSTAQGPLQKSITLEVNRQQLKEVLELISRAGGVYFSYNSAIVKKDSLVSFNVRNKTVKEVLQSLFKQGYEFYENGNYIIIRKTSAQLLVLPAKTAAVNDNFFSVSGYVYDEFSGRAIKDVSVYEKNRLSSALTNENGYFRIKLKKSGPGMMTLTISKEFYTDTMLNIPSRFNQEVLVTLSPLYQYQDEIRVAPEEYIPADTLPAPRSNNQPATNDTPRVQQTPLAKLLLSSRQKKQSLNLKEFITSRPFQVSFLPGFTTHGQLGSQVISNFSLNILGGYTAGVNGFEAAGLFNIDKSKVKGMQVAGIFNVVGNRTRGFQAAGLTNLVLDSVSGLQTAGINNIVKGPFNGLQIGGIQNHVTGKFSGVQISGVVNYTAGNFYGLQTAGILNIAHNKMNGVQVSGLINYAKKLRGLQVGVINIADSSEGFSIGLITIVKHGYHKLGISANEIQNINIAYKTGYYKFYNILQAGMNAGNPDQKLYSAGYGIGSNFFFNRHRTVGLNPELSGASIYRGSWDYTNFLARFQLHLNVQIAKGIALFAGPTVAMLYSNQNTPIAGYGSGLPPAGYKIHRVNTHTQAWLGWSAGINIF